MKKAIRVAREGPFIFVNRSRSSAGALKLTRLLVSSKITKDETYTKTEHKTNAVRRKG